MNAAVNSTILYPKGRKGSRESHCVCRPSGYNFLHFGSEVAGVREPAACCVTLN